MKKYFNLSNLNTDEKQLIGYALMGMGYDVKVEDWSQMCNNMERNDLLVVDTLKKTATSMIFRDFPKIKDVDDELKWIIQTCEKPSELTNSLKNIQENVVELDNDLSAVVDYERMKYTYHYIKWSLALRSHLQRHSSTLLERAVNGAEGRTYGIQASFDYPSTVTGQMFTRYVFVRKVDKDAVEGVDQMGNYKRYLWSKIIDLKLTVVMED
jgi:hypothetical protein